MNPLNDYRNEIYQCYASTFKKEKLVFNIYAAERFTKAYSYYLRNWLPDKINANILDLACGSGKLLYYLKKSGYKNITGIDISKEQVKLAQQVIDNVTECEASDFLRTHIECFDVITGIDILEHLNKNSVINVLHNIYTSLKNNGIVILQTPNAESPWFGSVRYGDYTHEICFTPNLLSSLMELCGFVNIKVREVGPIPYGYSVFSSFRWLFWKIIRLFMKFLNLVETGSSLKVYTRVFIITAKKM